MSDISNYNKSILKVAFPQIDIEALSDAELKELQAKYNELQNGLNQGANWGNTTDDVEITSSAKDEQALATGETVSHYKNKAGDEVTEKKQGEILLERVIKHTDENNKVIETVITYQEGKPVRKSRKENGQEVSTTTYTKNTADNGVEYFTVSTENKDGSQEIINTSFIDQYGEIREFGIIDKTTITDSGEVKTFRQKVNSGDNERVMFVEQRQTSDGKIIIKMFDNMSYSGFEGGNIQERAQIAIIDGKTYEVTYDEAGNTVTHAMNNDNVTKLAKNFNMTVDELLALNPELKKGLKVNQNVIVSGRYNADAPEIIHQGTKSDAAKNYRTYVAIPQEKAKQQAEFEARLDEKVIRANGTYQSFGSVVNSLGNRENISIKDFVQNILKIDINTELGKKVLERLSMIPNEELAKISYADFEANVLNQQHFNNFYEVSAALSIKSGLNIQTKDEYKQSHTVSREKEEQNFYMDTLINLVDITVDLYEQYYDNATGTSFFMEKVRGLRGVDANELINKFKEMSNRFHQLKSLSPNAFKKALKDEYGIQYSEFDARRLMQMSQNPDMTYDDYINNVQKILGVKLVDSAQDDIESRSNWNMAGEMAVMFATLGVAGEMSAIKGFKMATMANAGKLGRAAYKPMAKLVLKTAGRKAAVNTMKFGKGVGMLAGASGLSAGDMGIYNLITTTYSDAVKLYDNRGEQVNILDSSLEGVEMGLAGGVIGGTAVRGTIALTDKALAGLSKYVKAIPTVSSKVTNAVGKLLKKSPTTTGEDIMKSVLENQSPTKFAQALGFGVEVAGFEVWNTVSTKLKGNIDPATGKLPPEWDEIFTANYLWEHFKSEFKNIGQCKLIAKFAMFKFGSNSAQALMAKQTVDMSKSLKNIKVEPTKINGREMFFVTDEKGNRYVLESTQQVVAFCNYSMRKDIIENTIGEGTANKGVDSGSAYTPAKADGITFSDFELQARNNGINYEVINDENGNKLVRRVIQTVEVLGMGKTTYEVTIFDKEGNQISETSEMSGKKLKGAHPSFFSKKASTKVVDNSHAGTLGMNTVVGGDRTIQESQKLKVKQKMFMSEGEFRTLLEGKEYIHCIPKEKFTEEQINRIMDEYKKNPDFVDALINQKISFLDRLIAKCKNDPDSMSKIIENSTKLSKVKVETLIPSEITDILDLYAKHGEPVRKIVEARLEDMTYEDIKKIMSKPQQYIDFILTSIESKYKDSEGNLQPKFKTLREILSREFDSRRNATYIMQEIIPDERFTPDMVESFCSNCSSVPPEILPLFKSIAQGGNNLKEVDLHIIYDLYDILPEEQMPILDKLLENPEFLGSRWKKIQELKKGGKHVLDIAFKNMSKENSAHDIEHYIDEILKPYENIGKPVEKHEHLDESDPFYKEMYDYYLNLKTNSGKSVFGRGNADEIKECAKYMASLPDVSKAATSMRMLTELVTEEVVGSHMLHYLPKEGEINPLISQEVQRFYDAYLNNIPFNNVLCPTFKLKNPTEVEIGDVFEVEGEKNIYIKSQDGTTTQLKMDKETYCKLFPPIERYATTQNDIGNCWQLTGFNGLLRDPIERQTVLECFSQDGDDIVINFPNGKLKDIRFNNGQLPAGANPKFYSEGALGVNLLEFAQAREIAKTEIDKYLQQYRDKVDNAETSEAKKEAQEDLDNRTDYISKNFDNIYIDKNTIYMKSSSMLIPSIDFGINKYRDGGHTDTVLDLLGYEDAQRIDISSKNNKYKYIDFLSNPDTYKNYLVGLGSKHNESRIFEQPLEPDRGLVTGHAYWLRPEFGTEGEPNKFNTINPWGIVEGTFNAEEIFKNHDALYIAKRRGANTTQLRLVKGSQSPKYE